jgi:hypothetical protein
MFLDQAAAARTQTQIQVLQASLHRVRPAVLLRAAAVPQEVAAHRLENSKNEIIQEDRN